MTRSASPSIRGYKYQFLKAIHEVLSLKNDTDILAVEGIEDVEKLLEGGHEAIQVKYLESAKLVPSSIKKPVTLMLEDYVQNCANRKNTSYRLYGHFGHGATENKFWKELAFFKECGTIIERDENNTIDEIKVSVLDAFKKKFNLEIGPSISDLNSQVIKLIEHKLSATTQEAENYYYNNAVNVILELSIQRSAEKRKITKLTFLNQINKKSILFGLWKKIELGEIKYKKDIKTKIKSNFIKPKKRLVLIDAGHLTSDTSGYGFNNLVNDILIHHTPVDQLDTTEVLTLVIKASSSKINEIKRLVLDLGMEYNDGHEGNNFHPGSFDSPMITNNKKNSHKIKTASYHIRIISFDTYMSFLTKIQKPDTVLCVSKEKPPEITDCVTYFLPELNSYKDISDILN